MYKFALSLGLLSALTFAIPVLSTADDSRNWSQRQDLLEAHLQPGQTPAAYSKMLRELGYTITAVNYNTPDYAEYEVVKGDRSYEVQMDLNEETGRATNIDITSNFWETNQTEAKLEQSGQSEQSGQTASLDNPDYVMVITPVYVETSEARTQMGRMVEELEDLPLGREQYYYRQALKQRGYQILDTATRGDRMQVSAEKDDMHVLLNIGFNKDTGESTQLSAFPLLVNVAQNATPQRGKSQQANSRSQQASSSMQQTMEELESLPTGETQNFYRNALQQRGFRILDTTTSGDETQFTAKKNGQRVALNVMFDDEGESTQIEANRLSRQQEPSSSQTSQGDGSSQASEQKQSRKPTRSTEEEKMAQSHSTRSSASNERQSAEQERHAASGASDDASRYADDLQPQEFRTQAERDLVERVRTRLNNDPELASSVEDIRIKADLGGEVTLRGQVASEQKKQEIATAVRDIKGVNEVKNRLQVMSSGSMARRDEMS